MKKTAFGAIVLFLCAYGAAQPSGTQTGRGTGTGTGRGTGTGTGSASASEATVDETGDDIDALRAEYLKLRDELYKSRARAAAVASALYSSKITIKLGYDTARYYSVDRAV